MRISTKVTVGFVGVTVVLASFAWWGVSVMHGALNRADEQKATLLARCTMDEIDRTIRERLDGLAAFARAARLAEAANGATPAAGVVSRTVDGEPAAAQRARAPSGMPASPASAVLREYLQQLRLESGHTVFRRLQLADRFGTLVAASGLPPGAASADAPWYRSALAGPRLWAGNYLHDADSGRDSIDLAVKLFTRQGDFAGILMGVLDLGQIRALLQAAPAEISPPHYRARLVDGHGRVLLGPAAVAEPAAGAEGQLVVQLPSKAFGADGSLGWSLRLSVPAAQVHAATMHLVQTLSVVLLGAVLGALAIGAFTVRQISVPLERLRDAATRVGRGWLDTRLHSRRRDEIGELNTAFNGMAARLQALTVSREFLDSILGNMSDLLLVTDREGRVRVVNRAFAGLLGVPQESLLGRDAGEVLGEPGLLAGASGVRELIVKGIIGSLEKQCPCADGRSVPVHFETFVMRDASGSEQGLGLVGVDLSKRPAASG